MIDGTNPVDDEDAGKDRYWRGNLLAAGATVFSSTVGGFIAQPLMPAFLHGELGIRDSRELALWTGLIASISPIVAAVASPLWGMVADRTGRRDMLVRASAGAMLSTGALALIQTPTQLAALRVMNGAVSGIYAGALGFVAAETPRREVARALGIMTTIRSLGMTIGPAIGGIAGTLVPLRAVFFGASLLMLTSFVPIFTKVHETAKRRAGTARPSLRDALGARGLRKALLSIALAQGLMQFVMFGSQQQILVRVIQLDPAVASLGGGLAYTAISLAGAAAGTLSPALLPRLGYRRLAIAAAVLFGLAVGAAAAVTAVVPLVLASALIGLGYGTLNPTTTSMLALETPQAVKATVFGLSSSAQWMGGAAGAIAGGIAGSALGPAGGLATLALGALAAAAVLTLRAREPIGLPEARRG